jgi:hypothetical protein
MPAIFDEDAIGDPSATKRDSAGNTPVETERLTVRGRDGRERALRITAPTADASQE